MATARKRNIEIEVVVDDKKAVGGLRKISGEVTTTGQRFSDAAKVIGAAIAVRATQAVADFVGDSIQEFSNLEQSIGATEAVFGKNAEVIEEWARKSADSFGLSESEFRQMSSTLGAMLKNLGVDEDEVQQKTVDLMGAASDLAATYGGPVTDAVGAISALLRGERDPIEKYAISFKQADVNARALALGLVDANGEIDKNAQIAATLDLFYEQAATAAGQFAREADTLAGKTERANAHMKDTQAILGEMGAPIQAQGLDAFARFLGQVGPILAPLSHDAKLTERAINALRTGVIEGTTPTKEFAAAWEYADGVIGNSEDNINRLIDGVGYSDDEVKELRDHLPELQEMLGLTDEEAGFLADTLENRMVAQTQSAMDAARHATKPVNELGREIKKTGDESEEAGYKIESYEDKIRRLTDPAFRALDSMDKWRQAQDDLNESIKEFGEDSDEARDAGRELLEATGDLISDAAEYSKVSGKNLNESIRELGERAKVPKSIIEDIITGLLELDGFKAQPLIDIGLRLAGQPVTPGMGRVTIGDRSVNIGVAAPGFDEGGVVPGPIGAPRLILAHGGETVLPTHKTGMAGPSTVVNYYAGTQISNDRILKEIQELARRQ